MNLDGGPIGLRHRDLVTATSSVGRHGAGGTANGRNGRGLGRRRGGAGHRRLECFVLGGAGFREVAGTGTAMAAVRRIGARTGRRVGRESTDENGTDRSDGNCYD